MRHTPLISGHFSRGNQIGDGQYHREQFDKLNTVRNVSLGVHQKVAWQANDAFIRATTSRWWQFGSGDIGDVYTDDGKIAAVQFPDVGATMTSDSLRSICVRVRANAFQKCDHFCFDFIAIHFAMKV